MNSMQPGRIMPGTRQAPRRQEDQQQPGSLHQVVERIVG
jgi:hypothetical protein